MESLAFPFACACVVALAVLVPMALCCIVAAWLDVEVEPKDGDAVSGPPKNRVIERENRVDLQSWHRQHRLHRYLDAHRKAHMKTLLVFALALASLTFTGCISQPAANQQQQLAQDYQFWQDEVTRLQNLVVALPPGKTRDKAVQDLQYAQWFLAFFKPIVVPTTQPVAAK